MPPPSSETLISLLPALRTSTETLAAPASREFSISSLTTDAGRSMTSPAAILLRSPGGRIRMLAMQYCTTADSRHPLIPVIYYGVMKKLLMKGNEAIAEAAVQAGCRFYAGYPITPQNEIPEYLSWRLEETGGVFIQAESEIA